MAHDCRFYTNYNINLYNHLHDKEIVHSLINHSEYKIRYYYDETKISKYGKVRLFGINQYTIKFPQI